MPTSTPSQGFQHFDPESRNVGTYEKARSWRLLVDRPLDWLILLSSHVGNVIWLSPLAAFAALVFRSRMTRFVIVLTLVMGTASLVEVWWYPHYGAPLTAALLILATPIDALFATMEME